MGIRADYWRLLRDYGFSPRVGMNLEIPSFGVFSLSGGLYYQLPVDLSTHVYEIMIPNPNYPNSPRPRFSDLELQRNWQVVFGFEYQFPNLHCVNIEAYYK